MVYYCTGANGMIICRSALLNHPDCIRQPTCLSGKALRQPFLTHLEAAGWPLGSRNLREAITLTHTVDTAVMIEKHHQYFNSTVADLADSIFDYSLGRIMIQNVSTLTVQNEVTCIVMIPTQAGVFLAVPSHFPKRTTIIDPTGCINRNRI